MKTKVYDYRLYVKGIFGRNRTVKFDSFALQQNHHEPLSDEAVLRFADEKLISLKIKGPAIIKITEQACDFENIGGMQSKSFMLFSDRVIRHQAIA